jgi:hypothetical protein
VAKLTCALEGVVAAENAVREARLGLFAAMASEPQK